MIAISAKMDPATAPAIAPPLIGVVFMVNEVADEFASVVVDVLPLFGPSEVDVRLVEVVEADWSKGVTPGVVVVSTVLSYPLSAAQPYPLEPEAYRYVAQY